MTDPFRWSRTIEPAGEAGEAAYPERLELGLDEASGRVLLSREWGHPREPWWTESSCTLDELLDGAMRAEISLAFGERVLQVLLGHAQDVLGRADLTPVVLSNWRALAHNPGLAAQHDGLPYQNNAVYGRSEPFVLEDGTELSLLEGADPTRQRFMLSGPGMDPRELTLGAADVLPAGRLFFTNSGPGDMLVLDRTGGLVCSGREYGIGRFWVELRHFQRAGDRVIGMYRNDRETTHAQREVRAITGVLGYIEFDLDGRPVSYCHKP